MIDPMLKPDHTTYSVAKRKKHSGLTLAIDFDHTIHDTDNPVPGKRMGIPLPGAEVALKQLREADHRIIIHTCKAVTENGKRAVIDWLDYYDLPYDDVTAVKPVADWYIDNKAIHHTSWTSTFAKIGVRP